MKNILLSSCILFIATSLHAQYYYNDIVSTQETNRQMKNYLVNKVKTMTSSGTDGNGVKASDYSEYYEVRENGRALKASSIVNLNKTVVYSRFDEQARVTSMIDSSSAIVSTTTYQYDAEGRVSRIQNTVRDSTNDFNQTETHLWIYNTSGKPEKMWRIIQVTGASASLDSLEVRFVIDENGNPGEEHSYKKGREAGYLYYYFDNKHRLSDIVRYNDKAKRLLPDIMFEYDDNDRVTQKITTTSSLNLNYLIWRYIYNDKGLKTKEALFNHDKVLTGKIDYAYTFER